MFVGGIIGAVMAITIVATLFIVTSETPNSNIATDDGDAVTAIPQAPPSYSKDLSLIDIFEKSEPGVVRVNVQKNETDDAVGGVGSGFVFDRMGHIITNAHVIKDATKVVVTFLMEGNTTQK